MDKGTPYPTRPLARPSQPQAPQSPQVGVAARPSLPMAAGFRPRPAIIAQNTVSANSSSSSFGVGIQPGGGNVAPFRPQNRPTFTPRPYISNVTPSGNMPMPRNPAAAAAAAAGGAPEQFAFVPHNRPPIVAASTFPAQSQFNGSMSAQQPQQRPSQPQITPQAQPQFQQPIRQDLLHSSISSVDASSGKPGRRVYPTMQQPLPTNGHPQTTSNYQDVNNNSMNGMQSNAHTYQFSNAPQQQFQHPTPSQHQFQSNQQQNQLQSQQNAMQPPAYFQPQNTNPAPYPDGYQPVPPGPHNMGAPQAYPSAIANPAMIPNYGAAPNQLAGSFQNMQINGGVQPVGVNLFANPPSINQFHSPAPVPDILQQAVSNSLKSNASPEYKRCTLNKIPQTASLLGKSALPFGILITPFHQLLDGEDPVPVIQAPQIVRCRRCRTYINPWVQFIEQGTRWKCNMCFLPNDVPTFFDWDPENRNRLDRLKRAELSHGVVEFVAPQEYMVRPPQPVVIVFVIDVSYGAVQSGMVAIAAKAILESLDGIPNADDRTKIGFITFDSSIHFYNLSAAGSGEPHMLIVSDLEQPYLPIPYDLLVSLAESRSVIESLLHKLPTLFGSTQQTLSAMGKALKSAEKLIGSIGGKIICLQHSLPNHDDGSLKMREDAKLLGTAKEIVLLQPATSFYKNFAVDCSPSQISIDLFLFNSQYADVATLSSCAKFTGGCLYYYPGFSASCIEDSKKFARELIHLLSRPLGLEAVLRIRASKGIKMSTFHGNFFLRSTDLLSLPNVNPDNSFTIELSITEDLLKTSSACFQTALLYTSSNGERRIRVLTLSLPVSSSLSEIYIGADQRAISAFLIKKAIDRSLTSKIEDARDALLYKVSEILGVYKASFNQATHPQQLMISENLQLLPIFILAMIKNIILREGNSIPSDMRSFMLSWQYATSPEIALVNIYPRFWSLESLFADPSTGLPGENGAIVYPPLLNLSSEKLNRGNIFLLENGLEIFIWVGRAVTPDILMSIFGQPNPDAIFVGKSNLSPLDNDFSRRLRNIIEDIRRYRMKVATIYPHLYIAREDGDPSMRMLFLSHFVEDRIGSNLSYPQFLATIRERVQKMKF